MDGEYDVVIVGAGTSGIAAAREVKRSGLEYIVLEAKENVGGRCSAVSFSGAMTDIGAHYIHAPEINPLAQLAPTVGVKLFAAGGAEFRSGVANLVAEQLESLERELALAQASIYCAGNDEIDNSCLDRLKTINLEWSAAVQGYLGPFLCGADLGSVSSLDYANSAEREVDAFAEGGFYHLLRLLAHGLNIHTGVTVSAIEVLGQSGVRVATNKGTVTAKAAILTVSTSCLLKGLIRVRPDVPIEVLEAVSKLPLRSYERVLIDLGSETLGLGRDKLVLPTEDMWSSGSLLANVGRNGICFVDVGGPAASEPDLQRYAIDWLCHHFGSSTQRKVLATYRTDWMGDRYTGGAFSVAMPGHAGCRQVLRVPIHAKIWLAGEATHLDLWGTAGGAWNSGTAAAMQIVSVL